jgi:propionyl-CoA synthetase
MFSSPTALSVLRKYGDDWISANRPQNLRTLFIAGEALDESTSTWISRCLAIPVVDNYWQTETGWPVLSIPLAFPDSYSRAGSPGVPMYGFDVRLIAEASGRDLAEGGRKGVLALEGPLPPGCLQTLWRDDKRYLHTYWHSIPGREVYNAFDWTTRDEDGYYFILGRTDDVMNVAGHGIGTREIEDAILSHAMVVEAAVVGVHDPLRGQQPVAFIVPKTAMLLGSVEADRLHKEVVELVHGALGALQSRPLCTL